VLSKAFKDTTAHPKYKKIVSANKRRIYTTTVCEKQKRQKQRVQ